MAGVAQIKCSSRRDTNVSVAAIFAAIKNLDYETEQKNVSVD